MADGQSTNKTKQKTKKSDRLDSQSVKLKNKKDLIM